jgi:hypothetical protein
VDENGPGNNEPELNSDPLNERLGLGDLTFTKCQGGLHQPEYGGESNSNGPATLTVFHASPKRKTKKQGHSQSWIRTSFALQVEHCNLTINLGEIWPVLLTSYS